MHDFDLHAPEGANKRKRIIGRGQGSGRGTTAGKGNKGQKSRSGGKTYAGFEGGQMPLFRRLAHRGFSNHPFKKEYQVVNLAAIEKKYEDSETVDAASLVKKGLVKGTVPVKILGDGKLSRKLTFKVEAISASAREKAGKAGGTVICEKKDKGKAAAGKAGAPAAAGDAVVPGAAAKTENAAAPAVDQADAAKDGQQ
ncbi:MAG: 50S ribosomal protein L15 [Treponema sp.]|jgi:large subunit ribosomal protein L15|nr:50S ribosomal protein L15 [Treponema sp.]